MSLIQQRFLKTVDNYNYLSSFTPSITKNSVAGSAPDLGFVSGGTNITFTETTSSDLRGLNNYTLTKDAANRQGEQVILPFTLSQADLTRVLKVLFDYKISSGTYATGDVGIYVAYYDSTATAWKLLNNNPIDLVSHALPSDTYWSEFQTSYADTSYRVIIHIRSASASAYTLKFDDFRLGRNEYNYSSVMTAMQSWPIQWTSSGSQPSIGNGVLSAEYRIVGEYVFAEINLSGGSTTNYGTGVWSFTLPVPASSANKVIGSTSTSDSASFFINGTIYDGRPYVTESLTTVTLRCWNATSTYSQHGDVSATVPATFNSTSRATIKFSYRGQGLSATNQMAGLYTGRSINFSANKNTGTFPAGSSVMAGYNTPSTDSIGAFNATTGIYTVKEAGFYSVSAGALASSGFFGYANIYMGGSYFNVVTNDPSAATMVGGSAGKFCNVGDQIWFEVYSGAGGSYGPSFNHNYLSISKSSNSSPVTLMNSKVFCFVNQSSGQVIPSQVPTTIIWNNKEEDSHNAYSNGIFTAPRDGILKFRSSIWYVSGFLTVGTMEVWRNSTQMRVSPVYYNAADRLALSISGSFKVAKSDQVFIKTWQADPSARALYAFGSTCYADFLME